MRVRTALLEEPEHGLTDAVLDDTDVLTWWGHCAHEKVDDAIAQKVIDRVRAGMGLVVLHSGHHSKPFRGLMGTTANLAWRVGDEKERLWILRPGHPLVNGLPGTHIDIPVAEMYGEPFDVPDPDELVLVSWFEGGEVFRSGCVWNRGAGKVVFLRPGHETYPIYYQPEIRQLLANAVQVAAPVTDTPAAAGTSPPCARTSRRRGDRLRVPGADAGLSSGNKAYRCVGSDVPRQRAPPRSTRSRSTPS